MEGLPLYFLVMMLAFAGFSALFGLISAPAIVLARRQGEGATVRRFVRAVLIAGAFFGVMFASSRRLTDQCVAEGNTQCYDSGATGLTVIVIVGFVVVSGVRTWRFING